MQISALTQAGTGPYNSMGCHLATLNFIFGTTAALLVLRFVLPLESVCQSRIHAFAKGDLHFDLKQMPVSCYSSKACPFCLSKYSIVVCKVYYLHIGCWDSTVQSVPTSYVYY